MNTTDQVNKQLTYLARALKAPRIGEAAARLADQSPTWPGMSRTESGLPWASTATCAFVVQPPRECPSARSGGSAGKPEDS